jgi:hypothetical protein
MTSLAAGVVGALLGLVGVLLGAWLNSRREHQRWIRDQQLRAAVAFLGATAEIYAEKRGLQVERMEAEDRRRWRTEMRDGRSGIYLLCEQATIRLAQELEQRVVSVERSEDGSHDTETIDLLGQLVRQLRRELRVPSSGSPT